MLSIRSAAVAVASLGFVALTATPAQAIPTSWTVTRVSCGGSQTCTQAKYTAGTGQIRATQRCSSSSGQSEFVQYGAWVGKNVISQTPGCTYYLGSGVQRR